MDNPPQAKSIHYQIGLEVVGVMLSGNLIAIKVGKPRWGGMSHNSHNSHNTLIIRGI